MEFNQLQMAAMVKAGNAMALADGKVEEKELAVISTGLMRFGIVGNQVDLILQLADALKPIDMISTLSSMSLEQKKFVCGYLSTIMASDADIDESELKLWRFFSGIAGFPEMTLAEASAFWLNK